MKVLKRQITESTASLSHYDRKLLLHFDQHNTIQVACALPDRLLTVEEGLNNFLTSAVWGKEIDEKWVWVCDEPMLLQPENEPDSITYYKYLEKNRLLKTQPETPEKRIEFKKKTAMFVYEEPGKKFRPFFDQYLQGLRYQSQNDSEVTPCNTIPSSNPSDTSAYHLILPCFFDMIRRLQKANRQFTVILRTMGIESESFLKTVNSVMAGNHREFMDLQGTMQVNMKVGELKRYENDKFKLIMDGHEFETEEAIYAKLCSLTGINAIRDDFDYWLRNKYECYAGKPLWIDFSDQHHQHILFDDSIRLYSYDDCIVNVRLKNKNNSYERVNFSSYKNFECANILQPNLIELLKSDSERNQYVELLKKSEVNYQELYAKKEKIHLHSSGDLVFIEENGQEKSLI